MQRRYNKLAAAIIKKSEEDKTDIKDLIREWVQVIEKTRVVGWNRDEFLEEIIRIKDENEKLAKSLK